MPFEVTRLREWFGGRSSASQKETILLFAAASEVTGMRESASQLSEIFGAALNAQRQYLKDGSFANSCKVGRSV